MYNPNYLRDKLTGSLYNPNYLMQKLTGSQINTFVMKNDKLNKIIEIQDEIDANFQYGAVREHLEDGVANAQEDLILQMQKILE